MIYHNKSVYVIYLAIMAQGVCSANIVQELTQSLADIAQQQQQEKEIIKLTKAALEKKREEVKKQMTAKNEDVKIVDELKQNLNAEIVAEKKLAEIQEKTKAKLDKNDHSTYTMDLEKIRIADNEAKQKRQATNKTLEKLKKTLP